MSWAKPLVLSTLLLLSGCGFHPLYGGAGGDRLAGNLSDIAIEPIRDRPGQILRNNLIDRMHPGGEARYSLAVYLSEARSDLGLQRDASATYARLYMVAKFVLYDVKGQKTLLSDTTTVITSFSLPQGGFVNLVSEGDARQRALEEVSDEITEKVAVFLRRTES